MKRFRAPGGVRTRLLSLVVLGLLPLVLLDVLLIGRNFGRRVEHELQSNRELAEVVATSFLHYVDRVWATELAVGTTIFDQQYGNPSLTEVETLLQSQVYNSPAVVIMAAIDRDGIVIASTLPEMRGGSVIDREWFHRVLRGEDEVVSDLVAADGTGLPVISVVRGIRVNGQLTGMVLTVLKANELGAVLPVRRDGNCVYGLADRTPRSVYHSVYPDRPYEGRVLRPDSPARLAQEDQQAVLVRRHQSTTDGVFRTSAAVPIPRLQWSAYAGIPYRHVLMAAWTDVALEVVVLAVLVCGALVAAALFGRQMVRPVQALHAAASRVAAGYHGARADYSGAPRELQDVVDTFNHMAESVQDGQTAREQFVQIAAHELRNPMAGVKGALGLLRRRMASSRPREDLSGLVGAMEGEIDRLSTLLSEISEAFRLRDGHLDLRAVPTDLAGAALAAVEEAEASCVTHAFVCHGITRGQVWVLADGPRLHEVLRQLLSNAVKYSPDEAEVRIAVEAVGTAAVLSVADRGIGIPREQLGLVFDGFVRGRNLAGRDPGGLGLGLYRCREIIGRLGGRIWVRSAEGKGSTFYLSLPLTTAPATPSARATPASRSSSE